MAGRPRGSGKRVRKTRAKKNPARRNTAGETYREVGSIEGWMEESGQVGPVAMMHARMGHYGPHVLLYYDMTRRRISVSASTGMARKIKKEEIALDSVLRPGDYPYVTIPDDIEFTFLGRRWRAGVWDNQLVILQRED